MAFGVLDTEPETDFDNLAALAARACRAPICQINMIDARRQWCKAAVGRERDESPRETSICAATIRGPGLTVIVADVPSRDENVALHDAWNEKVTSILEGVR